MDASHFEVEVRGELEKKVDPPGRRHQSAQGWKVFSLHRQLEGPR